MLKRQLHAKMRVCKGSWRIRVHKLKDVLLNEGSVQSAESVLAEIWSMGSAGVTCIPKGSKNHLSIRYVPKTIITIPQMETLKNLNLGTYFGLLGVQSNHSSGSHPYRHRVWCAESVAATFGRIQSCRILSCRSNILPPRDPKRLLEKTIPDSTSHSESLASTQ